MNNIFSVITDFANKYDFIQQKDIEYIENLDFDVRNYNKINGKPFVSFYENENENENDDLYKETMMEEIIQKCKFYKLIAL
jgi:hypothetical protein